MYIKNIWAALSEWHINTLIKMKVGERKQLKQTYTESEDYKLLFLCFLKSIPILFTLISQLQVPIKFYILHSIEELKLMNKFILNNDSFLLHLHYHFPCGQESIKLNSWKLEILG